MKVLSVVAAIIAGLQLAAAPGLAACPYAVVESAPAPEVSVANDGTHVLQWKGKSVAYDSIFISDVRVQVLLEKEEFIATYSITNSSPHTRQAMRVYFFFEGPGLDTSMHDDGFISAGLLGKAGNVRELGPLEPECQLYERSRFPSQSLGDFTSRYSLRPGMTETAEVRGMLKVRGAPGALSKAAQELASSSPKLKMLITARELRGRP